MALTRAHARTATIVGLLLSCSALAVWYTTARTTNAAIILTYSELTETQAAEIHDLRGELGLTRDALAAMDLSDEELETALAAVRSWYFANTAELRAAKRGWLNQRAKVRHIQSEIRQGGSDAETLSSARTTLAQRRATYDSLLAGLRTSVLSECTDSEQSVFASIRSQTELPMPYRALDLTEQQAAEVVAARRAYRGRMAVELPDDEAASARQSFESAVATAIGAGNVEALGNLQASLAAASVRVVAAEQRVFPVTDEES